MKKHKFPKPGTLFKLKKFQTFALTSKVYLVLEDKEKTFDLDVGDIVMFLSCNKRDVGVTYKFLWGNKKISCLDTNADLEYSASYSPSFNAVFEEIKTDEKA